MSSPRANAKWMLLSLAAAVVVLALVFRPAQHPAAPLAKAQVPTAAAQRLPQATPPAATNIAQSPSGQKSIQEEYEALRGITSAAIARQRLAALRQALSAMPTNQAVAAIRQFLDSKADTATHLGFKLSSDGTLNEAPTMRTFLLDELGRLDPAAAADYAKGVLAGMDSPDEWAVALRDLAWGDSSDTGRELLADKISQLLQYAPWQQDPSAGYLEAFDVAVYVGGADLVPTLTDLVRLRDNPAVAHASFLALDRMVINDPTATLAALEDDPDLMQGREATRADYFARADVRDAEQRQILESYLLNPQFSASELNTFAGIFPNGNYMISANLLTQTPTPDHAALVSRDAQSLAVVQQWQADPRFAGVQPALARMALRLQQFVQEANANQ